MGKAHARSILKSGQAGLEAVHDERPEAAQVFAAEFGGRVFRRAEDMLRPDVIDALVLCTPPSFRNEYAIPALERGIHVLAEKPMARHMPEAVELARVAREAQRRGVVAATAYVWRYSRVVRKLIETFRADEPCLIDGAIYHSRPPEAYMWLRDKRSGGGQVLDMTTHIINALLPIAGDARTVYAQANSGLFTDEPGFVNDDASALTLRFARRAVANLSSTYALFHAPHTTDLHGVQVHVIGRHVHAHWKSAKLDIIRPEAIERTEGGPDMDAQFLGFAQAVRLCRPADVPCDMSEALRTVAVSLAANESMETGAVVDLAEYLRRFGAADFLT
jgi:predicted dehydrogenase